MNITLDAILLIIFLFNFIIIQPFSWGAANREIYFSFLFIISFIYILLRKEKVRFLLLISLILFIYGGSTAVAIINRRHSVPWEFAHDSVFQNEIAGRMLLEGKNPYKETYLNSGLENFKFEGNATNPAAFHLVTLPFLLLLNTILQPIIGSFTGYFDGRVIYLMTLPVFLIMLARYFRDMRFRNIFLIVFFFNPMAIRYFTDGRTDFFVTFLLFATFYFLQKKRYGTGGIVLAFALATKLTAWIMLPYVLAYFYSNDKRVLPKVLVPCVVLLTALFIPFIMWDASAFFASTVGFFFGGGAQSYPVSGYGFSKILLNFGFLTTSYDYFPFWIFQILFCIPLLVYQFIIQNRMTNIGDVFMRYGLFLFVFWFFSHHFQDNYFIYITQIMTLGYYLHEQNTPIPKKV